MFSWANEARNPPCEDEATGVITVLLCWVQGSNATPAEKATKSSCSTEITSPPMSRGAIEHDQFRISSELHRSQVLQRPPLSLKIPSGYAGMRPSTDLLGEQSHAIGTHPQYPPNPLHARDSVGFMGSYGNLVCTTYANILWMNEPCCHHLPHLICCFAPTALLSRTRRAQCSQPSQLLRSNPISQLGCSCVPVWLYELVAWSQGPRPRLCLLLVRAAYDMQLILTTCPILQTKLKPMFAFSEAADFQVFVQEQSLSSRSMQEADS